MRLCIRNSASFIFLVSLFSFTKKMFLSKIESVEKKINLDLVSGFLIVLVGIIYLSYNWGSHSH